MRRASTRPKKDEKILKREDLRRVGSVFAVELRLLVSSYYLAQEMRKRLDMQLRHLGDKQLLDISKRGPDIFAGYEGDIHKKFSEILADDPLAQWLQAQRGIGPVISAGLLAHIDIELAPTVGHIWRFAGLDPSMKWEKGEKR